MTSTNEENYNYEITNDDWEETNCWADEDYETITMEWDEHDSSSTSNDDESDTSSFEFPEEVLLPEIHQTDDTMVTAAENVSDIYHGGIIVEPY